MGLLAKLFNESLDSEFRLAQDLVAIAVADGNISDVERDTIVEICQKEGINPEAVNACLHGIDQKTAAYTPVSQKEKTDYLVKLIRVMGADGNSTNMEIYLLQIIASKLGFSHLQLVSLVLSTANRRYFQGDIGLRTFNTFIHNVIDPKGKSLDKNVENLRTIFDDMAKNIPQMQNPDEDYEAFIQTMNKAVSLLIENTMLAKEFLTMGIPFESILAKERENAIKKWTKSSRQSYDNKPDVI